jgi:hypothetical protein
MRFIEVFLVDLPAIAGLRRIHIVFSTPALRFASGKMKDDELQPPIGHYHIKDVWFEQGRL